MHNKIPRYYYFINKLNKNDIKKLNQNIAVIYRNYNKKISLKKLKDFKDHLKKNKIKFFLANNIKLANQLDLDGAYIPCVTKAALVAPTANKVTIHPNIVFNNIFKLTP